jgi:predicted amidohydrolase YtcJ
MPELRRVTFCRTAAVHCDTIDQATFEPFLMRTNPVNPMLRTTALAVAAVFFANDTTAAAPDVIYHSGPIVTMNRSAPEAEALAVAEGKIVAVGNTTEILATKGPKTRVVDLDGKALLPGFIDPHSHFFQCGLIPLQANCSSPPAGPCQRIADIITQLQHVQQRLKTPEGQFVFGYGFDPDLLAEHRHPTKTDLDRAFPKHPVIVMHVSGHGAVLNSLALEKFGISEVTPTPSGGVIGRMPGSQEPDGLLMETAWLPVASRLPTPPVEMLVEHLAEGQQAYTSAGITTAQEGATGAGGYKLLRAVADRGGLVIDVVAYPLAQELSDTLGGKPPMTEKAYRGRLRLGGVKVLCDGSPQGRTAFFTTPYLDGGPAGQQDWRGEPTSPQTELNDFFKKAYDNEAQVIAHCNGDAAIDMFLEAHRYAAADDLSKDRRTVGIHSQFIRPDQIQRYVDWKLTPSFFTVHTFYFGEAHVANRGQAQAAMLSPFRSALDAGLRPTNHTDFPVVPIDQMFVVHTAVNRTMRSGETLGADERITPLEALEAITIHAARQYREEDRKGSLEVGKLADLVVLSASPLTVPHADLNKITVVETIKEGTTVWPVRR